MSNFFVMMLGCPSIFNWEENVEIYFIHGSMYLLGLVIPASVFFCLWRVFITNNSPRVLSLGIYETSSSFVPEVTKQTSASYLFCYFLTCATTFALGVFASKVFQVLQEILNGLGVTYLVVPDSF